MKLFWVASQFFISLFMIFTCFLLDSINIKILNAGAWARSSDRVTVSLPMELEDYIPQVEEFYRQKHSGRKLQWHHLMSNGIVSTRKNPKNLDTGKNCCNYPKIGTILGPKDADGMANSVDPDQGPRSTCPKT